jgi:hypothetical protein
VIPKPKPDLRLTDSRREWLLAIEQHGSQTAAAAALDVPRKSVTQAVYRLSRQLEVPTDQVVTEARRRGLLDADAPAWEYQPVGAAVAIHERVQRPDGTTWVFDPKWGRSVHAQLDGSLLVTRTGDVAKAADMASIRWKARYGQEPMLGVVEWRHHRIDDMGRPRREKVSGNGESRTFPVVVFAAPLRFVSPVTTRRIGDTPEDRQRRPLAS